MASFITIIIPCLFILSSATCFASPPPITTPSRSPFKKIYAFGDSYTDTGNTHSSTSPSGFSFASKLPYGITFFHRPTNRYSDGRLVIDFVAQSLSLPYLSPYLNTKADRTYGINFAIAGSTAIQHSFFVENNLTLNITPQSLQTQLNWFNNYLETQGCRSKTTTPSQCNAAFDDSLIWVGEIGANDYAYTIGSSVSDKTIQRIATASVTRFLLELLNKGAKYVVVQGLPTTGCLTFTMSLAPANDRDKMGCVRSANQRSYDHNAIIQTKLTVLKKQFPNSVIVYADYWNAYSTVIKNAGKYGFKELYKVCCGSNTGPYNYDLFAACGSPTSTSCTNPSQYINWDGVHLTEAMYKVLADSFLNGTFCQPTFGYMISRKQQSG